MAQLADLLSPFCEAASISIKDCGRAVRKRFVVSLSFVDARALHDTLFGEHLDWAGVADYLGDVTFSCAEWMLLVGVLDFAEERTPGPALQEALATALSGLRVTTNALAGGLDPIDTMRLCFARARLAVGWDALCKALLLCNLQDVDALDALQRLLGDLYPAEQIAEVVRFLPACRHTRAEYGDAFALVLGDARCQVRVQAVLQSMRERDALREAKRGQRAATAQRSALAKPSLTRILEAKRQRDGGERQQDSFNDFCDASRMASSANARVKQVAYYLACLPDHPERAAQVGRVVGGDAVVQQRVLALKIVAPDRKALRAIVGETRHTGAAFEELRQFREQCVSNCYLVVTTSGRRVVHWTTVLRLYLAAYCRPDVWKDLWSHVTTACVESDVHGVRVHTAPEVEAAVQAFVRAVPLNLPEAIGLMLAT